MCASGSDRAEQHPDEGQRALDDRAPTPPRAARRPRSRREGHRREAVEHRLQRELVDAAAEAVVERAEDGQRADAEQQGCGEPPLDEPLPRRVASSVPPSSAERARHPGLDRAGEPLEPVLDPQQRAGDASR